MARSAPSSTQLFGRGAREAGLRLQAPAAEHQGLPRLRPLQLRLPPPGEDERGPELPARGRSRAGARLYTGCKVEQGDHPRRPRRRRGGAASSSAAGRGGRGLHRCAPSAWCSQPAPTSRPGILHRQRPGRARRAGGQAPDPAPRLPRDGPRRGRGSRAGRGALQSAYSDALEKRAHHDGGPLPPPRGAGGDGQGHRPAGTPQSRPRRSPSSRSSAG